MSKWTRRGVLKASAASAAFAAGLPGLAGCAPVEHPESRPVLLELLRRNQAYEWTHGFYTRANHAGMGLIALYRLGASPGRLKRYFDSVQRSSRGLEDRQKVYKLTPKTWTTALGDDAAFHAYRTYFRERVKTIGLGATLRAHVPQLVQGAAAAAFHCLIKLGSALDLGDEQEIVLALSWWAQDYVAAPSPPPGRKAVPLAELVRTAAADRKLAEVRAGGGIANRMQHIYRSARFRAMLAPVSIDAEDPLGEIAATVRQAFTDKHHFTLLHGLTSTHAMRRVLPYLTEPAGALGAFGHALTAAYLTAVNMSRHALERPLPAQAPTPDALRTAARASDDVHVIKVTYACLDEARARGDNRYLRLAARDIRSPARFT